MLRGHRTKHNVCTLFYNVYFILIYNMFCITFTMSLFSFLIIFISIVVLEILALELYYYI